jgi:hypothetical protein
VNLWHVVRAQWDRFGACALFSVGALALVLGWVGVSKQALTALQIPYVISGGLGGIFLLGLGAVLWLSADIRDEWRKLDAIEATLSRALPPVSAEALPDPGWDTQSFAEPVAARAATPAPAASGAPASSRGRRRQVTETS